MCIYIFCSLCGRDRYTKDARTSRRLCPAHGLLFYFSIIIKLSILDVTATDDYDLSFQVVFGVMLVIVMGLTENWRWVSIACLLMVCISY